MWQCVCVRCHGKILKLDIGLSQKNLHWQCDESGGFEYVTFQTKMCYSQFYNLVFDSHIVWLLIICPWKNRLMCLLLLRALAPVEKVPAPPPWPLHYWRLWTSGSCYNSHWCGPVCPVGWPLHWALDHRMSQDVLNSTGVCRMSQDVHGELSAIN